MQNQRVQTFITQKIAGQLSKKLNSDIEIESVTFTFFKKIKLNKLTIYDQQSDTLLFAETLAATIDTLKIRKRKITLHHFEFEKTKINISRNSLKHFNFSYFKNLSAKPQDSSKTWNIACNSFSFKNAVIKYDDKYNQKFSDLFVKDLYFNVSDFKMLKDSINFFISDLHLNDGKNLKVNKLSAHFNYTKNNISVEKFTIETPDSKIENSVFNIQNFLKDSIQNELQFDLLLNDSKISFYELAELIPPLRGMNQTVSLSGRIYGNLDDLKGKDLRLSTGNKTSINFDFYLNDVSNINSMYLFIDLKKAETNFTDISNFNLPYSSKTTNIRFPESFYSAGQLFYRGNFSGFLSDFVAFGTLTSEMGELTTDLSVVPEKEGNTKYQGKVATSKFKLDRLLQIQNLGILTFNGNIDGTYNKNTKSIYGNFLGYINEFEAYNYLYRNIVCDGIFENRKFDGLLSIDDPNLKFNFSGQMNLNPVIPVFDFQLDLDHALPGNLNLSEKFPFSELSFEMMANFEGNQVDNLSGNIDVKEGIYKNRYGEFGLTNINILSERSDTLSQLHFNSDYFNLAIEGEYHFESLVDELKQMLSSYTSAFQFTRPEQMNPNIFNFEFEAKNLDSLTRVFIPDYKIETPFLIYGEVNSENNLLKLNGSLPGFSNSKFGIHDIFIGSTPSDNGYSSKIRFGEIRLKNNLALYNLLFDTRIQGNNVLNKITWTNFHDLTYSGSIDLNTIITPRGMNKIPKFSIEGSPTRIYMADSLINISAFTALIDSSTFKINDFNIEKGKEKISLNGEISLDKVAPLTMDFENIRINEIQKYLQRDANIKGLINGSISVANFYDQRMISSDLQVNEVHFNEQKIGDISLNNWWNNDTKNIQTLLKIVNNNRESLTAQGIFDPSANIFDYTANVDNLSLIVLEAVIRKNFSNLHGDGSGHIRLHGTPQKLYMDGAVMAQNAGLTIDYSQVSYHFTDSVYFKGDTIHFDKINVFDPQKNTGVFDGTIVHDNFKNMRFAMNVTSPKITAINTKYANNEQFFGKVIASGSLDITGQEKQVTLSGRGTTLSGTDVNISLNYDGEMEQYDFIEFVQPETSTNREFVFNKPQTDGLTLDLTVQATPEAKAQLIYNSQVGDVIKAQGEGILKFGMDKEGNITLAGNYTINRGDYLFTLQNVINKRFSIEQGGSLVWSGDPYSAILDINAVYKLKASLYDLLVNSYEDIYQNQRIPVECKILLTENILNPEINFEIVFPTVESRIIDELQQYFSTEEDLNKQILSLLVLGKFYTPEYMRGTYEAQNPNVLGTTASELFSNQLSNWLSQISNNVDVGLNYRPGNQITNDEIELALSTQMFNDRVTLNGNIGNNVNPNSTNNSQIVGDFEVNVKLNPSGKIQLKAYNRSNNNLIYETAPYTQGVGFSFKEEFNTIKGLLFKMKQLFGNKKTE